MKQGFVERIGRLLVLIPFVAGRTEGVPVGEVLEFAGYRDEDEFRKDLELARQIAVPPEAPDDFVDIELEGERVHVRLSQGFRRPPRLTVVEAAALLASVEPLRKAGGGVLEGALTKLRRALPVGCEDSVEALSRCAALDASPVSPWHGLLTEAIEQRREIEVDYWAASKGEARTRRLEPRSLLLHHGHWYLAAEEVGCGEEHLYRLDRISGAKLGERSFAPKRSAAERVDADALWFGPEADLEVEVRFSPKVARLVCERFGEKARVKEDGSVDLVIRLVGEAYAISWVLGYGGEAVIVRPDGLRQKLAERVEELRRVYAERG